MDHTLSLFERTPQANSESREHLLKETEAKGSQACPGDQTAKSSWAMVEAKLLPAIELSTTAAVVGQIFPGAEPLAAVAQAGLLTAMAAGGSADLYRAHCREINHGAMIAGEAVLDVALGPMGGGTLAIRAGQAARALGAAPYAAAALDILLPPQPGPTGWRIGAEMARAELNGISGQHKAHH